MEVLTVPTCKRQSMYKSTEMELWGNGRNEYYKKKLVVVVHPLSQTGSMYGIFSYMNRWFSMVFQGKYKPIRPMNPSWI